MLHFYLMFFAKACYRLMLIITINFVTKNMNIKVIITVPEYVHFLLLFLHIFFKGMFKWF